MYPNPVHMSKLSFAVLALAALASAAQAQSDRKTLSGSQVAIYNLVGRVTVEQGSGSEVVVEISRDGRDAKRLKIEVGDVRGRNALRVVYPDDDIVYPDLGRWSNSDFRINTDGTWGGSDRDDRWGGHRVRVKGSGSGTEAWADIKVFVPSGKDVAVYLGVGRLEASRVTADLKLSTSSGRVTVNGVKGNLLAEAGSGGVEVRGATGDDVRLTAGSGSVSATDVNGRRLRIETGSGGLSGSGLTSEDLSVTAGSGSIRLDDVRSPRARMECGSGGIRVAFASPVKTLDASSGSGGITVSLPGGVNAEVDISTGSGGIDSDFAVTVNRMERHHLRGQIGDGSGRIHITSGSGSVYLRKF